MQVGTYPYGFMMWVGKYSLPNDELDFKLSSFSFSLPHNRGLTKKTKEVKNKEAPLG